MTSDPVSREFFEAKYEAASDPWNFASSPSEQHRYDEIMRTLGHRRFQRAFEPGCSIGVLTERLATICDTVLAIDISAVAVARARARCIRYPQVVIQQGALPDSIPPGQFDLVVFSEIGYYMTKPVLESLASELVSRLIPEGNFLASHWLGVSKDHALAGDEVHATLQTIAGLTLLSSRRYDTFRIDSWGRN